MRISNNQMFLSGLNSMLKQQNRLLELSQQLSTGKKIQTPADDPIAAARIDLMRQRIELSERLQSNRQAAEGTIRFEESILSSTVNVLQRLRELQVQAGNDSMSEADREALAKETENLLEQLQGLANTKDNHGYYIFSGSKTSTQPITRSGNIFSYNGDDTRRFQDITSGLQVALNDTGLDLFMRIPDGNGVFSVSESGNAGTVSATSGSVIDSGAYVADDYTISIAQNTSGEQVVMVTGAISGNVIPPSGAVDDAPLYTSGNTVTFNGIEITLEGEPAVGDTFSISPAQNQSMFSTVSDMVTNLRQPFKSAIDKAHVQTENNQILEQLDSALDNILAYQADIGARLNQLDVADKINGDLILTSKDTLSKLEDADLVETKVAFDLQMVYLQLAQKSFSQIQGLSAFNFI
tara:strand:- start:337 stop:1563 length:1227 start_codon:yes stop_codon:yes gene_type:complete